MNLILPVLAAMTLCQQVESDPAARSLTVAEVLNRWEAGTELIESYDLVIDTESITVMFTENGVDRPAGPGEASPVYRFHSHILKKAGKKFGEFGADNGGHYSMTLLNDGKNVLMNEIHRNEFSIQQDVVMFGSTEKEDYEATYRAILGTMDRIAISRTRAAKLLPREKDLYVLDVPSVKEGLFSIASWRIWLDSTKNFMPIRWSQWVDVLNSRTKERECTIELKQVAEGIWAPVAATIHSYNTNENSKMFGKIGGISKLSVDESKSRFNPPLSDDQFVAKIPDGALVVDRIRNVVYKQGR